MSLTEFREILLALCVVGIGSLLAVAHSDGNKRRIK